MARDLLVRGFDNKTHSQLGDIADEMGVSLNSIVKDAVDKWLKQQSRIPHKHDLILYDDDTSVQSLIKSVDRIAKEGDLFRSYCGPPTDSAVKLLSKLKWFNGTIKPYSATKKNISGYCGKVMANVKKQAKGKQVCCMDFVLGDIAKHSLKHAIKIESGYNSGRIPGLMFCPYKTETLLDAGISDMMDLFYEHDQIFILKDDELHKLHVTKESVHKLFLN